MRKINLADHSIDHRIILRFRLTIMRVGCYCKSKTGAGRVTLEGSGVYRKPVAACNRKGRKREFSEKMSAALLLIHS